MISSDAIVGKSYVLQAEQACFNVLTGIGEVISEGQLLIKNDSKKFHFFHLVNRAEAWDKMVEGRDGAFGSGEFNYFSFVGPEVRLV